MQDESDHQKDKPTALSKRAPAIAGSDLIIVSDQRFRAKNAPFEGLKDPAAQKERPRTCSTQDGRNDPQVVG